MLEALGRLHGRLVHARRVERLASHIGPRLRPGDEVLDVGAGDGRLGANLAARVPGLAVRGYDLMVRPDTRIPVCTFDGRHLPEADGAVDVVLLVDVLHHADAPLGLLREAARAARRAVIVKDHRLDRPLAVPTLALIDLGRQPPARRAPAVSLSAPRPVAALVGGGRSGRRRLRGGTGALSRTPRLDVRARPAFHCLAGAPPPAGSP